MDIEGSGKDKPIKYGTRCVQNKLCGVGKSINKVHPIELFLSHDSISFDGYTGGWGRTVVRYFNNV